MIKWDFRTVVASGLIGVAIGSAVWDQATAGKHPTSSLLGMMAQLTIGALFGIDGVVKIVTYWGKPPKNGKEKARVEPTE